MAGAAGLVIGFGMDWLSITPIIKRIATSSFVLASGGWALLGLALFYWWIDIKGHNKNLQFFTIVGMNSLFIYLFFEIVGGRWFNEYMGAITNGLMGMVNIPNGLMLVISSIILFFFEWKMCQFLFRKGIFFKI